jgi:hypothetical protein
MVFSSFCFQRAGPENLDDRISGVSAWPPSTTHHSVDLPESSDGLLRRYLHLLDIRYIQLENLDVVICGQLALLSRRCNNVSAAM